MQIILKENPENGLLCLFDTRSEKFFPGSGIRNPKDRGLLNLANNLVKKTPKTIHNIIKEWEYLDDWGYAEGMLAKNYFKLNPDLYDLALISKNDKPERKSRKLKEAKPLDIDPETGEVRVKIRGKAGRPKRIWTEDELEAKANPIKRSRGRPRKDPLSVKAPYVKTGGKRGRPSNAAKALALTTV